MSDRFMQTAIYSRTALSDFTCQTMKPQLNYTICVSLRKPQEASAFHRRTVHECSLSVFSLIYFTVK